MPENKQKNDLQDNNNEVQKENRSGFYCTRLSVSSIDYHSCMFRCPLSSPRHDRAPCSLSIWQGSPATLPIHRLSHLQEIKDVEWDTYSARRVPFTATGSGCRSAANPIGTLVTVHASFVLFITLQSVSLFIQRLHFRPRALFHPRIHVSGWSYVTKTFLFHKFRLEGKSILTHASLFKSPVLLSSLNMIFSFFFPGANQNIVC